MKYYLFMFNFKLLICYAYILFFLILTAFSSFHELVKIEI